MSRSAVWSLILSAADAQGVELPLARLQDVVPHSLGTRPPAGRIAGRGPAAVAARLLGVEVVADAHLGDLEARLDAAGMGTLYREVELPAEAVAVAMRRNGVALDVAWLQELEVEFGLSLASARERIWEVVGRRLNPESDRDVSYAATRVADPDRLARLVEDYRGLRRSASTTAGLLRRVDPRTGRVHSNLDPLGAETGRFACGDPPLQCLPRVLRDVVVAGPGNVLVAADFSQVELRVLAHFSRDPGLLGALRLGADLHRRTAAYALGVPEAAVTAAQRHGVGKAVNFGVVYGKTATDWPGHSASTTTARGECSPTTSPATPACGSGSTRPVGRPSATARSRPCSAGAGDSQGFGRATPLRGRARCARPSTP